MSLRGCLCHELMVGLGMYFQSFGEGIDECLGQFL